MKQSIKAEAPVACYSKGDMGRWEMTVTIKGGKPLSETELSTLKTTMAEVAHQLEQWRRENT